MFHIIWYLIIGLLAGLISKSVMHLHMTLSLDTRAWRNRVGSRRRRYTHNFSPEERTISPCWPHFFNTERHPDPLHLP